MRYMINQISNRDTQLLHEYRILRQPSDYLSPIFRDTIQSTQILSGTPTEEVFEEYSLWKFDLGVDLTSDKIPYIEFKTRNESDFRNLQSLIYLDGNSIFGFIDSFQEPIDVSIYSVDSLGLIEDLIAQYLADLGILNDSLDSLRGKFKDKLGSRVSFVIAGRDQNLIQFTRQDDELALQDSHYKLVTTLVGQSLVNPSQITLSLIPKVLSHDILITITDGKPRVLQGFTGFTIFIMGNGNWVFRDVKSTLNIAATSKKSDIRAFNCSLLYLRSNSEINSNSNKIELNSAFLHRTNCIVYDGFVEKCKAIGQSTLVLVNGSIGLLEYLGPGSTVECLTKNPKFKTQHIFGNIYAHGYSDTAADSGGILSGHTPSLTYISGYRIGFLQGQTDFEMLPDKIASTDVDNIHIHDWSELPEESQPQSPNEPPEEVDEPEET